MMENEAEVGLSQSELHHLVVGHADDIVKCVAKVTARGSGPFYDEERRSLSYHCDRIKRLLELLPRHPADLLKETS